MKIYKKSLIQHYTNVWKQEYEERHWDKGPFKNAMKDFSILEFKPNQSRAMWTYATCGMSSYADHHPLEIYIFSEVQDKNILELLTAVSYLHKSEHKLNLGHTVNFGKPWQVASECSYGLISLPYLDGPNIEFLNCDDRQTAFCYWLIPITKDELEFKKKYGLEALEEKFDDAQFNYLDPNRKSVLATLF